jgi:hypothetical protein
VSSTRCKPAGRSPHCGKDTPIAIGNRPRHCLRRRQTGSEQNRAPATGDTRNGASSTAVGQACSGAWDGLQFALRRDGNLAVIHCNCSRVGQRDSALPGYRCARLDLLVERADTGSGDPTQLSYRGSRHFG